MGTCVGHLTESHLNSLKSGHVATIHPLWCFLSSLVLSWPNTMPFIFNCSFVALKDLTIDNPSCPLMSITLSYPGFLIMTTSSPASFLSLPLWPKSPPKLNPASLLFLMTLLWKQSYNCYGALIYTVSIVQMTLKSHSSSLTCLFLDRVKCSTP